MEKGFPSNENMEAGRTPRPALPFLDALLKTGRLGQAEAQGARQRLGEISPGIPPLLWLASLRLPDLAAKGKLLDEDSLVRWLSKYSGLTLEKIDPLQIEVEAVVQAIPAGFARHHCILALRVEQHRAVVACADPFRQQEWVPDLGRALGREICPVLAYPSEILRYMAEFYHLSRSVEGAASKGKTVFRENSLEQLLSLGTAEGEERHTEAITDWLLRYALEQEASDIHLEPRRERAQLRLRIDGTLHTVYRFPVPVARAIVNRLKILGRMDVTERRRPQDGRLRTRSTAGSEVEFRLSTMPTACGEKLVARLLDPRILFQDFAQLGLRGQQLRAWQTITGSQGGIALVAGPTGSGKTTTLYTTLQQLASTSHNVCTVEDPIEIVEPTFNQTQVHPEIGLDFSAGIRALLRQDPDIIMVGEIRDTETARMAVQAALTGHRVLATVHAGHSTAAIIRLLDLGVPAYLVRATLAGVMAQRLARRLCVQCRRPAPTDPALWQQLSPAPPPVQMFRAEGCTACRQRGYRGRTGLFEVLPLDEDLHAQIQANTGPNALRKAIGGPNFRTLREAAAELVTTGAISVEEALRAAV